MKPLLPVLCLALASCATLSSDGARVELVEIPPPNAQYLGRVSQSTGGAGALFAGPSHRSAVNGALSKAAKLGATHLMLDADSRDSRFWGFSQHVAGNAYRVER